MSGTHTKCVANTLLHLRKKRTSGISSRPAIASKSILGKPPSIVSKVALVSPVVAKNNTKKDPKVSEFLKKKAQSTRNWQRWIEHTHNFKCMTKLMNMCVSNPMEPTPSSGSILTLVPSLSPSCDAGGSSHSLDC